ncbi:MAG TPA: helix-turn-helix transcriptional regulator [Streptosporangiaceae bacterium]|nr:helix-turn-helix transcriptional regulator [Streptosporangiaceae bacterium]
MKDDSDTTTPLDTFGEELRAHRTRAKLQQAEVAPKLFISTSLEGAIENGRRLPKRQTAKLCDELFDAPGTFLRLWRLVMQRAYPLRFGLYAELEADATRIHVWEMRYVPGLLQTPDYARAILNLDVSRGTDDAIDADVTTRMARQGIFTKDDAPLAWFVIDESVLYRAYGGKDVMREQIQKLITMAAHPRIVIQIMPFTVTDHPGPYGPLIIFELNDSQPIAYAEGRGSGRLIETRADVAEAIACYDLIRAAALPRSATLELLKARLTSE